MNTVFYIVNTIAYTVYLQLAAPGDTYTPYNNSRTPLLEFA